MKAKILFIICLGFAINLHAQTNPGTEKRYRKELDLHSNWGHIGYNLSLNYNHYFGRHAATIGIKYHMNQSIKDNQDYSFKDRGHAQNLGEAIGLNLGYRYDILKDREIVTPYLFIQTQLSYLSIISSYNSIEIVNNNPVTTRHNSIDPYYFISENVIGIGMTTKIYRNWYLNQSAGIGMSTYRYMKPIFNSPSMLNTSFDPATLLRMGLTYRL